MCEPVTVLVKVSLALTAGVAYAARSDDALEAIPERVQLSQRWPQERRLVVELRDFIGVRGVIHR